MKTTRRFALWLALAGMFGFASALSAAEGQLPCRPSLVPCNYAEHFSGKIHMRSTTKVAAPPSESVDEFTVTVVDGKAACVGTVDGKTVGGPGLLAIERGVSMEDEPGQPWYSISAACPDADGTTPNIDNGQVKTYKQKDSTGFTSLSGKTQEDNPDVDPVNGVTGTITMDWSFTRKGGPQP
jgi:hypothetical protein